MTSPALSPAARRRRSRRLGLVVGCALLLFAIAASLAIGSRPVPLGEALDALRSFDPTNDLHLVVRELSQSALTVAYIPQLEGGAWWSPIPIVTLPVSGLVSATEMTGASS